MRLTLVLVFTTLGIVAKAKPKSYPLLVKANVAVKIKSGSTDLTGRSNGSNRKSADLLRDLSNGRSVLAQDPTGKIGGKRPISRGDDTVECEKKSYFKEVDGVAYSYCSEKGTAYPANGTTALTNGNYVRATLWTDKKNLNIGFVLGTKCEPKPDGCNCKTLLEKVVSKYKTVERIILKFMANPPIHGCNCYLGTAARNGFKSLDIENCHDDDIDFDIIDFDKKNYSAKCKALIERDDECWRSSTWYIKK